MYRDSRWWYYYWIRKGHIPKRLESSFIKIDSAYLYNNREVPFEKGEENFVHGYRVILFEDSVLVEYYKKEVQNIKY